MVISNDGADTSRSKCIGIGLYGIVGAIIVLSVCCLIGVSSVNCL